MKDNGLSEVLSGAMIVGMGAAFLWHFSNIYRYGTHTIQEPTETILNAEVGALLLITLYGLSTLVKGMTRR